MSNDGLNTQERKDGLSITKYPVADGDDAVYEMSAIYGGDKRLTYGASGLASLYGGNVNVQRPKPAVPYASGSNGVSNQLTTPPMAQASTELTKVEKWFRDDQYPDKRPETRQNSLKPAVANMNNPYFGEAIKLQVKRYEPAKEELPVRNAESFIDRDYNMFNPTSRNLRLTESLAYNANPMRGNEVLPGPSTGTVTAANGGGEGKETNIGNVKQYIK